MHLLQINKSFILFTLVLLLLFSSSLAHADVEVKKFKAEGGSEENFLIVTPNNPNLEHAYPILFAPGDKVPSKTMFFWGDNPDELGWVIVQTERVYKGSDQQLKAVIDEVVNVLHEKGIKVESKHIIGWSANSSRVSQHAAALPGVFDSLTLLPGYSGQKTVTDLCKQPDLHISFITGSRDQGWLRGANKMKNQLATCNQNPSFEIIKNGGHVLSELNGRPLFDRLEKNWK